MQILTKYGTEDFTGHHFQTCSASYPNRYAKKGWSAKLTAQSHQVSEFESDRPILIQAVVSSTEGQLVSKVLVV